MKEFTKGFKRALGVFAAYTLVLIIAIAIVLLAGKGAEVLGLISNGIVTINGHTI